MAEPFVGEIKLLGFPFAPRGYATCDGQIMAISQNQALFSLLGIQYGGNGVNTFALPDLRGCAPVHFLNATLPQASRAGAETVTINPNTMPAHTHALVGTSATANKRPPGGRSFANDTSPNADFYAPSANLVAIAPQTLGQAGQGQAHTNMQPYLVMNYCIALQGIFPSRN